MLVFLTSIRHPHNSNDFAKVEALFESSLRSVCSQTHGQFRVVVVCNSRPRIDFQDPRVVYHLVDFPPPSTERCATNSLDTLHRDKGTKLLSGMLHARRFSPEYFFIFDADDLVSRRLAEFARHRPGRPGWYVDAGFALDYATGRIQRKNGLVRYCGTSLMPNARELLRLARLDASLDERSTQAEMMAHTAPKFIDHVIGDHTCLVPLFARHNLRMRPLPFRGSVWVQQTGENNSGIKGVGGVPATSTFCEEFGVDRRSLPTASGSIADHLGEAFCAMLSKAGSVRDRARVLRDVPLF
jgi:hypothetical protein